MFYLYYAKQDSFEWTPFHYKEELKTLVDRGLFLIRSLLDAVLFMLVLFIDSVYHFCYFYWAWIFCTFVLGVFIVK